MPQHSGPVLLRTDERPTDPSHLPLTPCRAHPAETPRQERPTCDMPPPFAGFFSQQHMHSYHPLLLPSHLQQLLQHVLNSDDSHRLALCTIRINQDGGVRWWGLVRRMAGGWVKAE